MALDIYVNKMVSGFMVTWLRNNNKGPNVGPRWIFMPPGTVPKYCDAAYVHFKPISCAFRAECCHSRKVLDGWAQHVLDSRHRVEAQAEPGGSS